MKRVAKAVVVGLLSAAVTLAHAENWIPRSQCTAVAQLAYDGAQMRDDGATLVQAKAGVYIGAQNAQMSDRLKDVLMTVVERTYKDETHRFESPSMIGGNVYGACMKMSVAGK